MTPTLYDAFKLHKDNVPLRSVLSVIGSCSYQNTVRLSNSLKQFCDYPTIIKDSFEFSEKITSISNLHKKTLVSFEVKRLFTNIPFDFTLNLILEKLFIDKSKTIYGVNKNQF